MTPRILKTLFLIILLVGCSEEKVKPVIDRSIKVEELPAQESWNSKVVFSDSGKTKAVLTTGHLRVFNESQETLLDSGVQVDFYNDLEIKTTTLNSDKGKVEDATQNLYAIGDVIAVNDSGVTLETDELMWRNKDKKIVSNSFVTIITNAEKIQGYGFESDQGLRNYIIRDITYVTRADTASGEGK